MLVPTTGPLKKIGEKKLAFTNFFCFQFDIILGEVVTVVMMAENCPGGDEGKKRGHLTSREALRILRDEIQQVLDETQCHFAGFDYYKSILQRSLSCTNETTLFGWPSALSGAAAGLVLATAGLDAWQTFQAGFIFVQHLLTWFSRPVLSAIWKFALYPRFDECHNHKYSLFPSQILTVPEFWYHFFFSEKCFFFFVSARAF